MKWARWRDEKLLDLRFCDLRMGIAGSGLEPYLNRLYSELSQKGITHRPHFWLSYEWFVPDGVPGIAIPFYLAHPRLAALEQKQMLEIEGGNADDCMKILRHEAGHAIENAYRLRQRRDLQQVFGPSTVIKYPSNYFPKPYSRSFVRHIEPSYAQSHPDEDFAETFAVWLTPDSDWRERYRLWPALEKLVFMDNLMASLAKQKPLVAVQKQVDPISKMRRTLRQHYEKRRQHFGLNYVPNYDSELERLFTTDPKRFPALKASEFIAEHQKEARRKVSEWTGEYQYLIDKVILEMQDRCEELKLFVKSTSNELKSDLIGLLAVQTMHTIYSGRHRVAL